MGDAVTPRRPGGTVLSLQYVRGVGAAMVVVVHASGGLRQAGLHTRVFFLAGHSAVDMFFVLSGFVITWSTLEWGAADFGRYWRARVVRVYPLYLLATLAAFVALGGATGENARGVGNLLRGLVFVPSALRGSDRFVSVYGPAWTLSYEVLFYVLFGIALRWWPSRRVMMVSGVSVGLVIAGLLGAHPFRLAAFVTDPIVLEFVAGMWLAVLPQRLVAGGTTLPRVPLVVLHIAAWVVIVAFGAVERDRLGHWRALRWGLPAMVIVGTAVLIEVVGGGVPAWPWLRRLGDASYAVYMTHLFVIWAGGEAWQRLGWTARVPSWLLFAALFLASHMVGLIVDRWFDVPVRRRLARALRPRSAAASEV